MVPQLLTCKMTLSIWVLSGACTDQLLIARPCSTFTLTSHIKWPVEIEWNTEPSLVNCSVILLAAHAQCYTEPSLVNCSAILLAAHAQCYTEHSLVNCSVILLAAHAQCYTEPSLVNCSVILLVAHAQCYTEPSRVNCSVILLVAHAQCLTNYLWPGSRYVSRSVVTIWIWNDIWWWLTCRIPLHS